MSHQPQMLMENNLTQVGEWFQIALPVWRMPSSPKENTIEFKGFTSWNLITCTRRWGRPINFQASRTPVNKAMKDAKQVVLATDHTFSACATCAFFISGPIFYRSLQQTMWHAKSGSSLIQNVSTNFASPFKCLRPFSWETSLTLDANV